MEHITFKHCIKMKTNSTTCIWTFPPQLCIVHQCCLVIWCTQHSIEFKPYIKIRLKKWFWQQIVKCWHFLAFDPNSESYIPPAVLPEFVGLPAPPAGSGLGGSGLGWSGLLWGTPFWPEAAGLDWLILRDWWN